MKTLTLDRISESMIKGFLYLCVAWTVCALAFQLFFVYLEVTGQQERTLRISNHLTWKFDGNFKNIPGNVFYEGPAK